MTGSETAMSSLSLAFESKACVGMRNSTKSPIDIFLTSNQCFSLSLVYQPLIKWKGDSGYEVAVEHSYHSQIFPKNLQKVCYITWNRIARRILAI